MTVRTTVGEFATDSSSAEQNSNKSSKPGASVSVSVGAMPLERFIDCLDMLFEQLLTLLKSASGVDEFCQAEGLTLMDSNDCGGDRNGGTKGGSDLNGNEDLDSEKGQTTVTHSSQTAVGAIVVSAAELSSKSIAELLRLRKEVHSMVSLDEIRQMWDTCMKFIEDVEKLSGHKCTALRSMLFVQAKAFVERKHESNMSALAAALDSERWTQCEVSYPFFAFPLF
jgi:nucleoside-triphosphatase THEP1